MKNARLAGPAFLYKLPGDEPGLEQLARSSLRTGSLSVNPPFSIFERHRTGNGLARPSYGETMRTTKRFTPKVLARFVREARGSGTYSDYIPWHRVSRGDPSSSGRSHLLMWRNRLRELLSDGELDKQLFASMLVGVGLDDVLEQFPLSNDDSQHILLRYGLQRDISLDKFPGTIGLAERLGIKHPKVREGGVTELWKPTTDFLLIFKSPSGSRQALAVAAKPNRSLTIRQKQLLSLEREFWVVRGVPWLLITPDLYDLRVALTLRRIAPWALGKATDTDQKQLAAQVARESVGHTLTLVLERIASYLGNMDIAQRALWQCVWHGDLHIDLRRGWRPSPLQFVSQEEFWTFNPIASRRSAWI